METFITMRALAASPLMMGGDLPTLDDFSLRLITDPEMIACNQNGVMGSLVFDEDGVETWKVDSKGGGSGGGWIGVFNRMNKKMEVDLTPRRLGLPDGNFQLLDIWGSKPADFGDQVTLPPHGVLFMKFSK